MASFISAQRKVFEEQAIKNKEDLAEIIGIMLGDGGLYYHAPRGKYHLTVAFNKKETQYRDYVRELLGRYFYPYRFQIVELEHEFLIRNISVFIARYLIDRGLKAGNKTALQVTIPRWVFSDKKLVLRCIRGLFDTDGSVYRKYANYSQIEFKLASYPLVAAIRKALIILGLVPTRICAHRAGRFIHWRVCISRQGDIRRFFAILDPKNEKHFSRYKKINGGAEI